MSKSKTKPKQKVVKAPKPKSTKPAKQKKADTKLQIVINLLSANLDALSQRLSQAAALAKEAHAAMESGEKNQAIGTLLEFERLLPEAQALFSAALVLHRNHP